MGLEAFLQKTIRVSQQLSACTPSNPVLQPLSPSSPAALPAPEQMNINSHRLLPVERQRRLAHHLCLYCGGDDHQISTCPIRPPRPVVSTIHVYSKTSHLVRTPVYFPNHRSSVEPLIDSESAGNFISCQFLQTLKLSRKRCIQPMKIHSVLGKPLGRGLVNSPTHRMPPSGRNFVHDAGRINH